MYQYQFDSIKCNIIYLFSVQLVGQIGDPDLEAATWDRPEYLNATTRRVSLLDKANRGSDLAAETVAALASSAIAFKQQGNGPTVIFIRANCDCMNIININN